MHARNRLQKICKIKPQLILKSEKRYVPVKGIGYSAERRHFRYVLENKQGNI